MKLQSLLGEFVSKRAVHLLNLPLYYFSKVVPKRSNLWLFGSWYGQKYADSSKYLFEHISKNHPEIDAIWLSANQPTLELVRTKGFKAVHAYSLYGYWLSMRSRLGFVVTCTKDLNFFINPKQVINLWHGNPLKMIMHDDRYHSYSLKKSRFNRLVSPYSRDERFDYTLASSSIEAEKLASAFNTSRENILVTGLPRNDVFNHNNQIERDSFNIMYMPTHRGQGEFDVTKFFSQEMDTINQRLSEIGATLWVKLHFYDMQRLPSLDFSNIEFIDDARIEQDIYSLMGQVDILATDYSSIYFDFLLAKKPIIFLPFDLDAYMAGERELYYEYAEVTPGPKCIDWDQALNWIEKLKLSPVLYAAERGRVSSCFHVYEAGSLSENVYQAALAIVESGVPPESFGPQAGAQSRSV